MNRHPHHAGGGFLLPVSAGATLGHMGGIHTMTWYYSSNPYNARRLKGSGTAGRLPPHGARPVPANLDKFTVEDQKIKSSGFTRARLSRVRN